MIEESDITQQIPLVAQAASRRSARCPLPEQLAALVDSRLERRARSQVEEHLADCTHCLGQVGFLVRESRGTEAPPLPAHLIEAARQSPARRFSLLPGPALATLAATALLLVVAMSWQPDRGFDPAGSRTGSTTQFELSTPADRTVRNGAVTVTRPRIVLPGEGDVVTGFPLEVRWSASPDALQYSVQLLSLEGDLVWEDLTTEQEASIPPSVKLDSGQKYYVWVEAQLRSGGTSRSDAVAFLVAPD